MNNELNKFANEYNKILKSSEERKELKRLEQLRKIFIDKFTPEFIETMGVDSYVIGKGRQTFCYYIEYGLERLGSIRGANSAKYGIYYGKRGGDTTKDYRYNENLRSKNKDEAYKKVIGNILALLKAGEQDDKKTINSSKVTPMVRGKILFLYYPDKYLPIYSFADLDYFMKELGVNYSGKDILGKQETLIAWKNAYEPAQTWSLLEFQRFLYRYFGKTLKKNKALRNYQADQQLQNTLNEKNFKKETKANDTEIKKQAKEIAGVYVYPRDWKVAQEAIIKSGQKCEFDASHECFIRKKDGTPYTEAHHLVPLSEFENFTVNLDRVANVVSLCCNCHAKIHRGKDYRDIVKKLYRMRADELKKAKIDITEEDLIKIYNNEKS